MRVAVVHSFYRSGTPSGENVVVEQQVRALREADVEVLEVFRRTDDLDKQHLYKARVGLQVSSGIDVHPPVKALEAFRPDVIHVHNTFPNFGTRWIAKSTVPVVATVHNFRSVCANGLLYRDGHNCTECVNGSTLPALVHACYQDSRASTLPLAIATARGAARDRVLSAAAAVITQSRRVHDFLADQGIPESRLHLIPGFVEDRGSHVASGPTVPRFAFVGRATPEKGLSELLAVWPDGYQLDVFGADSTPAPAHDPSSSVHFHGVQERDVILGQLPSFTALLFPGRTWEGAYPLVVREALEAGVPVIALEGSGAADFVEQFDVGATYHDADRTSLQAGLGQVVRSGEDLRRRCRNVFEQQLRQDLWEHRTLNLYAQVMQSAS